MDAGSLTQAGGDCGRELLSASAHSTTYPPTVGRAGGCQVTRMLLFPRATAETF